MNKIIIGNYERITKKTAEKMYNKGEIVYICACKINPCGIMGTIPVNNEGKETFSAVCAAIKFYNCNHETGYYPAYYKKIKK